MCHALESVHQHMLPFLRYSMQSVSHFNTESRCNYSMTLDDYTYCTCTNVCNVYVCAFHEFSRTNIVASEHQVRSRTLPLFFLCVPYCVPLLCLVRILYSLVQLTARYDTGTGTRDDTSHATPRHATPRHAHICAQHG